MAKSMLWATDIMEHAHSLKLEQKEFLYEPLRKIIARSLNPDNKGMIGCFSSQLISRITGDVSKSVASFLLSELNTLVNCSAKSIKELFDYLSSSYRKTQYSYSDKILKNTGKLPLKSVGIQTDVEILSITSVVSVASQTQKTSTILMNDFKIRTQPPSQQNFLSDRDCELRSVINKRSRLFKHTKKHPDLFSKTYEVKKWSIDNLQTHNDYSQGKRVVTPSYYPSTKPSRAKFYFQKLNRRRHSESQSRITS